MDRVDRVPRAAGNERRGRRSGRGLTPALNAAAARAAPSVIGAFDPAKTSGEARCLQRGHVYTRDEIHAMVGGSKRACLPTNGGAVVAACLLKSFNPDAPRIVLCGTGPRNGPAGALLAAQAAPVPFFTRVDAGRWLHEGLFVVVDSMRSGRTFDRLVGRSTRATASVSRVVRLAPAD